VNFPITIRIIKHNFPFFNLAYTQDGCIFSA
jgi:hypothetical protein